MVQKSNVIESYIVLTCDSDAGYTKLEKMLNRILPNLFVIERIDEKTILLTLKDGLKSQAIFKASFSALLVDNESLNKALLIPSKNSMFYSYLDFAPDNECIELFKVAKNHQEVYYETYDLIASLDKEILDTVKVYIENSNSPLLSSYALFVHKNTVTYRLKMFVKKTGIQLDSFASQMFIYQLITSRDDLCVEEY